MDNVIARGCLFIFLLVERGSRSLEVLLIEVIQ